MEFACYDMQNNLNTRGTQDMNKTVSYKQHFIHSPLKLFATGGGEYEGFQYHNTTVDMKYHYITCRIFTSVSFTNV